MPQPLSVVIHTHASSIYGYGHLNRCLILGGALQQRGQCVRLMVFGDEAVQRFLAPVPWAEVINNEPDVWPEADLCIVDLYCYSDEYYVSLRKHFELIIIFDDIEYRVPACVAAIINANIYADALAYPPGIRVFSGSQYVLIRDEFIQAQRRAEAERILLCVGASDPENQMDRLLSILVRVTDRTIDAVYGPGFQQLQVIDRWRFHPRVRSHKAVTEMGRLMTEASYAVTGSGSMLYELAAVGVPTACLSLADNQKLLGATFAEQEAVEYLGIFDEISDAELEARLKIFDADTEGHERMVFRGKQLIDGKGPARLATALEEWVILRRDPMRSPYSRDEVQAEYEASSKCKSEHERVRWGSSETMKNRYLLVTRELPFDQGGTWLDVGCGTGSLQELVARAFPIIRGTGIELSSGLLKHAQSKNIACIHFCQMDFMDYYGGPFDFLTCLGVMAKTNFALREFFVHAAELLYHGGCIMVDFKHLGWSRFQEPDFFPETTSSLVYPRADNKQCSEG